MSSAAKQKAQKMMRLEILRPGQLHGTSRSEALNTKGLLEFRRHKSNARSRKRQRSRPRPLGRGQRRLTRWLRRRRRLALHHYVCQLKQHNYEDSEGSGSPQRAARSLGKHDQIPNHAFTTSIQPSHYYIVRTCRTFLLNQSQSMTIYARARVLGLLLVR